MICIKMSDFIILVLSVTYLNFVEVPFLKQFPESTLKSSYILDVRKLKRYKQKRPEKMKGIYVWRWPSLFQQNKE